MAEVIAGKYALTYTHNKNYHQNKTRIAMVRENGDLVEKKINELIRLDPHFLEEITKYSKGRIGKGCTPLQFCRYLCPCFKSQFESVKALGGYSANQLREKYELEQIRPKNITRKYYHIWKYNNPYECRVNHTRKTYLFINRSRGQMGDFGDTARGGNYNVYHLPSDLKWDNADQTETYNSYGVPYEEPDNNKQMKEYDLRLAALMHRLEGYTREFPPFVSPN